MEICMFYQKFVQFHHDGLVSVNSHLLRRVSITEIIELREEFPGDVRCRSRLDRTQTIACSRHLILDSAV
jgi:hypothetical protein